MDLQKAYEMVLNDIINSEIGIFCGKYDAVNGSTEFMNGVSTVMEFIAYKISEKRGDEFSDLFIKNEIESEKKAGL